MGRRLLPALAAALLALAVLAAPAAADPPGNDNRANARDLGTLPTTVTGTTVDATLESTDPGSRCTSTNNSVYYTFAAREDARVVVALQADGDLDAVVDVFRRQRSQLQPVNCAQTNRRGNAQLALRVKRGESFVIRISQLFNSVSGTFTLNVGVATPEARPPGAQLPSAGRRDTVDRIFNPSDAWSTTLRPGVTYRVRLAQLRRPADEDDSSGCVAATIFRPGATDFDDGEVEARLRCGGYHAFTPKPSEGGRFSFRISADSGTGALPYRIVVAPTQRDDTAPGIFVRNYEPVRGGLVGSRIDTIDMYRFDIVKRSDLTLRMAPTSGANFRLSLFDDRGRRLRTSDSAGDVAEIVRRSRPGRYFAVVRAIGTASGSYRFVRITRTITRSRIDINGQRGGLARPGQTVRINLNVRPVVEGPATVIVERFDPLIGWQFAYRYRRQVSNGRLTIPFTPPFVGRWRARADFEGTRIASPSATDYARVLVADPLED